MQTSEASLPKFVQFLQTYLNDQKKVDPSFSLNKFARKLSINPGILHAVLKGERKLSIENARKLGEKLGLSGEQIHTLGLDLIFHQLNEIDTGTNSISITLMAANTLVNYKKSDINKGWLAECLNISHVDAENYLKTLEQFGVIKMIAENNYNLCNSAKPTAWKMSPDIKKTMLTQANLHVRDHLEATDPPLMISENIVFYASSEILEKNRPRIVLALTNLVREITEEGNASGIELEPYFCFTQILPCKKL